MAKTDSTVLNALKEIAKSVKAIEYALANRVHPMPGGGGGGWERDAPVEVVLADTQKADPVGNRIDNEDDDEEEVVVTAADPVLRFDVEDDEVPAAPEPPEPFHSPAAADDEDDLVQVKPADNLPAAIAPDVSAIEVMQTFTIDDLSARLDELEVMLDEQKAASLTPPVTPRWH